PRGQGRCLLHVRLEPAAEAHEAHRARARHSRPGGDGADHGVRPRALLHLRAHFRDRRQERDAPRMRRRTGVRPAGVPRMVDLSVKIGGVSLANPILPASGTFSDEFAQAIDLNRLGALVTKTVSRNYRAGNPPPRVHELEAGMINSIGLPTKGLEYFLEVQLPAYKKFKSPLVCSITSESIEDFAQMARDVSVPGVDAIELNISCPTRQPGGGNFALNEDTTYKVGKLCRSMSDKPLARGSGPEVGFANSRNPTAMIGLIEGLEKWCAKKGIRRVAELTGAMLDHPPRDTYEAGMVGIS